MSDYRPPFHITDKIISLISEISEQVGRITVLQEGTVSPHLRREPDSDNPFFSCNRT